MIMSYFWLFYFLLLFFCIIIICSFKFTLDLRKLIKYEERLGVNIQQDDYYESLFRRTTASYRAKYDREIDKGDPYKRNSFDIIGPTSNRQSAAESRKVLSERNYGEKSTSSNDLLNSFNSSKSQADNKVEETRIDRRSLKALIENTLTQVLHGKYSQDQNNVFKEKSSAITSIVAQILNEKLSDLRHSSGDDRSTKSSEPGPLRSIIEDIVTQVLREKLSSLQKENEKPEDVNYNQKDLNEDLQRKLTLSNDQSRLLPREPVTHYNSKRPLDSQSLVQQLLASEITDKRNAQTKHLKKMKTGSSSPTTNGVKRLQRSPNKKPEWKDPSLHDKVLEKPFKAVRSQSPTVTSSVRSGRSKCSSSVLIRRSKSQGRKPSSDPVALYQYYKKEWEHFRKQIPGETSHGRLRWHVRQRFLDPE